MSIKIIHTADNHIGISYNSLSQAKAKLVKERLEALKRIVEKGNEESVDYLVIAGDLFDVARYDERRTIPNAKKDVNTLMHGLDV